MIEILQDFHGTGRKIFASGGYATFLSGRTANYTDIDIYITADGGDVQPDDSLGRWSCFGEDILKKRYMELFNTSASHESYNGFSDFLIRHNTHSKLECGEGLTLDVNLIDLYTFEMTPQLTDAADLIMKAHDMSVCRVALLRNSTTMMLYQKEQAGLSIDMSMTPERLDRSLKRQDKYRGRMVNYGAALSLLQLCAKAVGLEY